MSPPTWWLRPAVTQDCELLVKTCWQEMPQQLACDKLALVCGLQAQNRALGLVVVAEDVLIGYGQVMRWREGVEIADLMVLEMARGHGIGTALIQRLLDKAREWNVPYAELGVLQDNTRARALYERLGFVQHLTVVIKEQTVVYMRLPLG